MIDVHIVCGFLGCGKTTLMTDYLSQMSRQGMAVIVNEAGATTYDGLAMRAGIGELAALRMMSGECLCCGPSNELARGIMALQSMYQERCGAGLETVLVEASGLARPGPLLRQLGSLGKPSAHARVLALVDATLPARPDTFPEVAAQWAGASALILTKTDLAPDRGRQAKALARTFNPFARIVDVRDPCARALKAFDPVDEVPWIEISPPSHRAGHRVGVFSFRQRSHVPWREAAEWLDNLAALAGERLLRTKAVVQTDSSSPPVLVQSVGSTFTQPRRISKHVRGHAVVIASRMTAAELSAVQPTGIFREESADGTLSTYL